MNLATMTRKELWALDDSQIQELTMKYLGFSIFEVVSYGRNDSLEALHEKHLELQQSAAEHEHDRRQDR